MTAVKIAGTFKKDERPNNGLEVIAQEIIDNEFGSWVVVGVVTAHGYTKEPGEAPVPSVQVQSIEVVTDDDATLMVRGLIDKARAERNGAPLEQSLFDADGWARDTKDDDGDND